MSRSDDIAFKMVGITHQRNTDNTLSQICSKDNNNWVSLNSQQLGQHYVSPS